jgi:hypothetical protein
MGFPASAHGHHGNMGFPASALCASKVAYWAVRCCAKATSAQLSRADVPGLLKDAHNASVYAALAVDRSHNNMLIRESSIAYRGRKMSPFLVLLSPAAHREQDYMDFYRFAAPYLAARYRRSSNDTHAIRAAMQADVMRLLEIAREHPERADDPINTSVVGPLGDYWPGNEPSWYGVGYKRTQDILKSKSDKQQAATVVHTSSLETLLRRLDRIGMSEEWWYKRILWKPVTVSKRFAAAETPEHFFQQNFANVQPIAFVLELATKQQANVEASHIAIMAIYPSNALRSIPARITLWGGQLYVVISDLLVLVRGAKCT